MNLINPLSSVYVQGAWVVAGAAGTRSSRCSGTASSDVSRPSAGTCRRSGPREGCTAAGERLQVRGIIVHLCGDISNTYTTLNIQA